MQMHTEAFPDNLSMALRMPTISNKDKVAGLQYEVQQTSKGSSWICRPGCQQLPKTPLVTTRAHVQGIACVAGACMYR